MSDGPEPGQQEGSQDWALIDLLRRALVAGAGALFMTEEGIRSFLGEMKLPKEAIGFVLGQVAKSKQDLFRVLGQELRGFLENLDLEEQARRVLSTLDIKVEATIRIQPRQETAGGAKTGTRSRKSGSASRGSPSGNKSKQ